MSGGKCPAFSKLLLFFPSHPQNETMVDDLAFPDSVKDFVFDLHDASRRSFIPGEQLGLYQTIFREITAKVRYLIQQRCIYDDACLPRGGAAMIMCLVCFVLPSALLIILYRK